MITEAYAHKAMITEAYAHKVMIAEAYVHKAVIAEAYAHLVSQIRKNIVDNTGHLWQGTAVPGLN